MARTNLALWLILWGLVTGGNAWAQTLRGLGTLGPDGNGYSYSFPTGISADGGKIVGESSSAQGTEAFAWSGATGMVGLGALGPDVNGLSYSRASGISANGFLIIGQSSSPSGNMAFAWSSATGMVGLGTLSAGGESFSYATSVSADGATVVGDHANGAGYDAFVWTAATGMVRLGTPPADDGGYSYSRAAAISADGLTIVGERTNGPRSKAVVWRKVGINWVGFDLGMLPGSGTSSDSRATGVSADGQLVIGQHLDGARFEAFVWSAESNEMIGLGHLNQNGSGFSEAAAISADGSTIVGESFNGAITEAFRWNALDGMTGLGSLGGDSYANGVSADGAAVAGLSAIATGSEAYLWTVQTGQRGLGTLGNAEGGFVFSVANGISADGLSVFGHSQNKQGIYEAFVLRVAQETSVQIDANAKPGNNKLNLHSNKLWTIVIRTTPAFDATTVDPATIVLADPSLIGTGGASGEGFGPISSKIVDVDGDGDVDLQLVFDTRTLVAIGALDSHTTQVQLNAQTFDGFSIVGNDSVTIVPPPKKLK